MIAAAAAREGHALEREVVRLRAAAGEDDLLGAGGPQERGHLGPGLVQRLAGALAEAVHGGGVGEVVAPIGRHGGDDLVGRRRRGVVVEVDTLEFHSLIPYA